MGSAYSSKTLKALMPSYWNEAPTITKESCFLIERSIQNLVNGEVAGMVMHGFTKFFDQFYASLREIDCSAYRFSVEEKFDYCLDQMSSFLVTVIRACLKIPKTILGSSIKQEVTLRLATSRTPTSLDKAFDEHFGELPMLAWEHYKQIGMALVDAVTICDEQCTPEVEHAWFDSYALILRVVAGRLTSLEGPAALIEEVKESSPRRMPGTPRRRMSDGYLEKASRRNRSISISLSVSISISRETQDSLQSLCSYGSHTTGSHSVNVPSLSRSESCQVALSERKLPERRKSVHTPTASVQRQQRNRIDAIFHPKDHNPNPAPTLPQTFPIVVAFPKPCIRRRHSFSTSSHFDDEFLQEMRESPLLPSPRLSSYHQIPRRESTKSRPNPPHRKLDSPHSLLRQITPTPGSKPKHVPHRIALPPNIILHSSSEHSLRNSQRNSSRTSHRNSPRNSPRNSHRNSPRNSSTFSQRNMPEIPRINLYTPITAGSTQTPKPTKSTKEKPNTVRRYSSPALGTTLSNVLSQLKPKRNDQTRPRAKSALKMKSPLDSVKGGDIRPVKSSRQFTPRALMGLRARRRSKSPNPGPRLSKSKKRSSKKSRSSKVEALGGGTESDSQSRGRADSLGTRSQRSAFISQISGSLIEPQRRSATPPTQTSRSKSLPRKDSGQRSRTLSSGLVYKLKSSLRIKNQKTPKQQRLSNGLDTRRIFEM